MDELRITIENRIEAYEDIIKGIDKDNKFRAEYEAKVEELKIILNQMGC
ncbi:MAG: hypothetical protein IJH55_00185 [Romboutsia sp.]|nr:hypothetical protein [Romboutsia sp.]